MTWLRRRHAESRAPDRDRGEIRDAHEVIGSVRVLVARLNVLAGRLERYVDEQEGTIIHGPINGHT